MQGYGGAEEVAVVEVVVSECVPGWEERGRWVPGWCRGGREGDGFWDGDFD